MDGPAPRHIIGCMTGTSLDGLDAAVIRIVGRGLDIKAELLATTTQPLGDLADWLQSMAGGEPHPPIDYLRAARRLGELHAQACEQLMTSAAGGAALDLVAAHGQTICHAPRDPAGPLSWQLFDPWPIVRRLGVPVCYDLRQADLIAGGEGAPITPIADWIMYRDRQRHRAVVNLGGICNITHLPGGAGPDAVTGGDCCPCNLLIDAVVRRLYRGMRFDEDGRRAAGGSVLHSPLLNQALDDLQPRGPRSLGRENVTPRQLDRLVEAAQGHPPDDVLASVVAWVAQRIGEALQPRNVGEVILAGGGARNQALAAQIARAMAPAGAAVMLSDALGIACEAREAVAVAVLAAVSQDGEAITLPKVTGAAGPRRAGAWAYP